MSQDVFEVKWKEMGGQVEEWWVEQLTDDDLDRVNVKKEQLVVMLQQKYGYTKEHAQEEYDRRVKEYNKRLDKTKIH